VNSYRYKAFISYSHHDRDWGDWLQRQLEGYRIPKRLVGIEGEYGPIPKRLSPVFRDREDLSSASDLSTKVKESLEASETLLVICSPQAAQSGWVNEEVRYFQGLGREDRVLALIVGGDPQSESPDQQCFPRALTVNRDGTPREPLAADARKWADGKRLAKLKIVSGILGIQLDELRRRDQHRRQKNWIVAAISAAIVLSVTVVLAITAISSKKTAQLQRANTEELLSYMLGNLKRLDPIVGLEVVDQSDEQLLGYIESLEFYKLENDQLVEWGLQWRDQGMSDHEHGRLDVAMESFERSRAAFIELHQREGSTKRALFELGQAEFWVGYVHLDKGELDEAEQRFTRYGAITRRLVNEDPNDAEMVMELSYTLTNLGGVERARTDTDTDKALRLTQSALQYNQIALVLDPGNDAYRTDLNNKLAFLADAWMDTCDLGKAINFRQQNVDLSRELYEGSPDSDALKLDLAYSLSGLAWLQQHIPITEQALLNLQESRDLLNQLAEQDDGNPELLRRAIIREFRIMQIRFWVEPHDDLWPEMSTRKQEIDSFFLAEGLGRFEVSVKYAGFLVDYSLFAWRVDKRAEADRTLNDAMERLSSLVGEKPENRSSRRLLATAWFEHWNRYGKLPADAASTMLEGYLVEPERVKSCEDASLAAKLELMRGNISLAKDYTLYLLNKGFFEPGFVAFCKRNELCDK